MNKPTTMTTLHHLILISTLVGSIAATTTSDTITTSTSSTASTTISTTTAGLTSGSHSTGGSTTVGSTLVTSSTAVTPTADTTSSSTAQIITTQQQATTVTTINADPTINLSTIESTEITSVSTGSTTEIDISITQVNTDSTVLKQTTVLENITVVDTSVTGYTTVAGNTNDAVNATITVTESVTTPSTNSTPSTSDSASDSSVTHYSFTSSVTIRNSSISKETIMAATPNPATPPRGDDLVESAMIPVYRMANFLLDGMVHPRDISSMTEKGVNFTDLEALRDSFETQWEDWTMFWIGYAICVGVGIVALVFVPLVGMFVACCRGCGNCGGRIDKKEKKNAPKMRCCCGSFLFLCVVFLVLGVAVMIVANEKLYDQTKGPLFDRLAADFDHVENFQEYTVHDLEVKTVKEFENKTQQLGDYMNALPNHAMLSLDTAYNVVRDIKKLIDITTDLPTAATSLVNADTILQTLIGNASSLEDALTEIRVEVNNATGNCNTTLCRSLATQNLTLNINYTTIQLSGFINVFNDSSDLPGSLQTELQQFDTITSLIKNQTYNIALDIETKAKEIQKDVTNFTQMYRDILYEYNVSDAKEAVNDVRDDVNYYSTVFYAVMLTLCVTIIAIAFCYVIGLALGASCPLPQPGESTCGTTKLAARWLLSGIGLTFLFYFFYMFTLIALFTSFGVIHTDICRHAVQLNTTPVEVDQVLVAAQKGKLEYPIIPSLSYSQCANDRSLYKALEIEQRGINLTEIMDVSGLSQAIDPLRNTIVDIGTVKLLENGLLSDLLTLGAAVDDLKSKVPGYVAELQKSITVVDLIQFVDTLKSLNHSSVGNLTNAVTSLEQLEVDYITKMEERNKEVSKILSDVSASMEGYNITELTLSVNASEALINTNGNSVVKAYLNTSTDILLDDVTDIARGLVKAVSEDVGNCLPLFNIYVDMIDSACVTFVWNGNAFWFALGCITFFMLPAIICAFKLVTYYRKTGRFDENDFMSPLYDAYHSETQYAGFSYHDANDMQLRKMKPHPRTYDMGPVDNPVYTPEQTTLRIPRPRLVTPRPPSESLDETQVYSSQGVGDRAYENPIYSTAGFQVGRPSPPPSYTSSDGYDTRL